MDGLIKKWKDVCQEALSYMRDQIGQVTPPNPNQKPISNGWNDESQKKNEQSGYGIHPSKASTWHEQFASSQESTKSHDSDFAVCAAPRYLTLFELANMMQFDIQQIGNYQKGDDDFV